MGQPPEIVQRLKADGLIVMVTANDPKTPVSDTASVVVGYVLFDVPPEKVYRLLSQTERQIEYRSELSEIKTVKWEPNGPIDRHRIKILFQRYEYHLDYSFDPRIRHIRWELARSYENDFSVIQGTWDLHPMPGERTLARFTTSVELAEGMPRMLQDWFTARSLPSTLGNCRRWVNSGGRYRP